MEDGKLRFGSVFSGIGGLDLGFERAGAECMFQIEINPFCRAALEAHWPTVRRFEDVKTVHESDLPDIDILIGGPPCQPVSSVGRQGGDADPRWLWPEFIRLCGALQPRWVVAENPVGLQHHPSSAGIAPMLDAAGYEVLDPIEVGACQVGGVDHRHRLFVVAYRKGWGEQAGAVEHEEARGEGERNGQEAGLDVVGRREVQWPARPGHPQLRGEDARSVEPQVEPPGSGLPSRLARRWRRLAHEAVGNAVNPLVAEVVARAVISADRLIQAQSS